jgi:alpha,alpha-trehalase
VHSDPTAILREDYQPCLDYIEAYWSKIIYSHPKNIRTQIGLPHPFVAPSSDIFTNDQFYWDSYFTIIGLVRCGRTELAKGMIQNFLYLYKQFGIIPMRNRFYNLGGSQPPFLTSMINEVFAVTQDKRWMTRAMLVAEQELHGYWLNRSLTEVHNVFRGLSRYCDHHITHTGAEHESGWDMTSRFRDKCLDYLPIDLNSMLFKYESDLAEFYGEIDQPESRNDYLRRCEKRRRMMNSTMWNPDVGFFFDYDYRRKRQSLFWSVAGFYPLWAKLATKAQALEVVRNLASFEYPGGIANTQPSGLDEEFKQHDFPNGWPQQQYIVVSGLLNYGFETEARRIAKKFLDLNKRMLETTGCLWEKYDVVNCAPGIPDRYQTQRGFAWTNAVFLYFIERFAS